jgi:threonine synthase
LLCPHTAIGYRAAKQYQTERGESLPIVTLATAHPVKFRDVIEPEINQDIEIPERLKVWLQKEKKSTTIGSDFEGFKEFLIDRA